MKNDEPKTAASAAAAATPGSSDAVASPPPSTESTTSSPSALTPEERLQALESKTAKWKEAVAAQLNDAARKNKKLREELQVVRGEKEAALGDLRVQLTEEFQERTAMQREELADLTKQAALLREEKKTMAAAHEAELQKMRAQLREVIQLEVETNYRRKEEQWEKEKAALQTRAEAKETERMQAEHECEVLKLRLNRLGTQYEELASLFQPEGGGRGYSPTQLPTPGGGNDATGLATQSPNAPQSTASAAYTQQLENIKAELQSKEQHTQFVLDRAKQEHEAAKAQLLRELQLREEELKVAHTLLKQVQAESSGYLQRVSHAQTEKQALEQRYAAKVSALSEELTERQLVVDEAQAANRRLQEQLRAAQQHVATLEEESTMREEAFHSLMLSEDNKRLVMDLQRAVQTARDEAEEWKMQYYTAVSAAPHSATPVSAERNGNTSTLSWASEDDGTNKLYGNNNPSSPQVVPAAAVRSPQTWNEQLTAKEASLEARAAQLERKAHLLEAAEAKLNDMRRVLASQASALLQQQKNGGRRERNSDNTVTLREGGDGAVEEDDADRDMLDVSPIIRTAASLLPSALHGSLRTLEAHRRRLHLPGSCRCMSCFPSGSSTSGVPLRLRRMPVVITLMVLVLLVLIINIYEL